MKSWLKLQENQSLGSIKVQIKEIQDQKPFCKRSMDLWTQLSEIMDEIKNIQDQ
jgi:hypothetical protein